MRKFFTALIVIPLGLIFIVFAVANRHFVTVSFDPFNSTDPAVAVSLPLFVVIIAVAILGVVAGGMATWFRQRRWRRAARQHEADARRARAEMADLRAAAAASRADQQRLPAPSQRGILRGRRARQAGRDVVEPAPSAPVPTCHGGLESAPERPCPCSSKFAACPRARRSTSRLRPAPTWWGSCSFRRRRGISASRPRANSAGRPRAAPPRWR